MAFAAAVAATVAAPARAADAAPNIIWIMADDLGYGDLGCYGQKLIQTPNLDRMAAGGMRFTNAYAGSTVCAPSRCVLMTGYHTGHCYIRGNARYPLEPQHLTVAEVLKSAGYATALCGKWGLGEAQSTGVPTRQGFDYFYGYLNQHHAHNYYPAFLWRNETKVELRNTVPGAGEFGQGWATKRVDYSPDLVMAEALGWLDEVKDKRFFLYLSLTVPHANNEGARGTGNGQEVPDYGIYKDKDWTDPNKGQAAMITRMDTDLGRLFDRLKKYGIDEKTIVFFTSDNGPHHEGRNTPELFNPGGPLRGMKRDMYEGGVRVPMIARWPGKIQAGTVNDTPWGFWDLMATAADLAGVEGKVPADTDGISVVPALRQNKLLQPDRVLYWEFFEQGGKQAVRQGKWKAVRLNVIKGKPVTELYDLSTDLGEMHNIAAQHPDVLHHMEQLMAQQHTPNPYWKFPVDKPDK